MTAASTCWLTAFYWSRSEANMYLTRRPATPRRYDRIVLVNDDRNRWLTWQDIIYKRNNCLRFQRAFAGSSGARLWRFIAHHFKFSALGGLFICCMIQPVFWEGLTEYACSQMTKESGLGTAPSRPYPSQQIVAERQFPLFLSCANRRESATNCCYFKTI